MKLLIAIPSKGRADSIFSRTLRWLPLTGFDYKVLIEPQDSVDYLNHRQANPDDFVELGIDSADVGKEKGGLQLADREALADAAVTQLRSIYPAIEFKPVTGKSWTFEPVLKGDFFGIKKL
jgi:hypothetical protein